MIKEQIEQFQLLFNHYPNIMKRKKPFGPVLAYDNHQESTFRIDVKTLITEDKKEKVFQFYVSIDLKNQHSYFTLFFTFDEAYAYLEKKIKEERIRILFL